ncbi:hypothetical protein J2Z60_001083 [Lactobacillus colini]|uniref:Uncharacterized protein n=1 Tax=Lactobacillus colini TaxID=1819254 RepID=A0ABS4MDY9_9LACO|nr:hypothetical protein [Lactobacillus colini]MBP2057908.1 hypothetical protein [Lactobacillus colini]
MLDKNIKKVAIGGTIFDRSYAGLKCRLHYVDNTVYIYPIMFDSDWHDWDISTSEIYTILGRCEFNGSTWYLVQGYFSYTINNGANTAFPDDALSLVRSDSVNIIWGGKFLQYQPLCITLCMLCIPKKVVLA